MNRLCTICARGGSKGVPGKNIRPLLGKPLIAWSVEQAIRSKLFTYVAVSSDDPAILAAATAAGANLVIRRPDDLAGDFVSKIPVIRHAVEAAEQEFGERFDTLVDLDATSPLRDIEDIIGAVAMLEKGNRPNVITGAPARRSPFFNLVETTTEGDVLLSKTIDGKAVVRRQDAPPSFDMNASIYVWRRDTFLTDPRIFYPRTGIFTMPEERSQDIDTELDFRIVELIMKERKRDLRPTFRSAYDLTGRVAAVSGAAGILGKHFCRILAEHGAAIAVIDRDSEAAESMATELQETFNVQASPYVLDIANPNDVEITVAAIENDLGFIDILHNNAATKGPDLSSFFDSPMNFRPEVWREVMQVNVDGYFYMTRAAGTRMASRGRGSIIQTASIYGILGPDQRIYEGSEYLGMPINTPAVYSASKGAVISLTKYFATYWAEHNIRVNTLTPGGVSSGQNETFDQRYSARVPLGRMARPEEIAQGLLFLASDASSYVTGQNLVIDGGLTAW